MNIYHVWIDQHDSRPTKIKAARLEYEKGALVFYGEGARLLAVFNVFAVCILAESDPAT